ncbi:MAG: 2-oxo acid dehydrogenase subunit E2 [Elusimicrobia bacterium]|nr:2-oxo acid dehydrogenase subunit E2 [Elusimicrobiota bacterium]
MSEIRIPSPGESILTVEIVSWLVPDGGMVEKGAPLLEFETEKAAMTVDADESGRLAILAPAGRTAKVGEVVGRIESVPSAPEGEAPSGESGTARASEGLAPSGQDPSPELVFHEPGAFAGPADAQAPGEGGASAPPGRPPRPGETRKRMSLLRQTLSRRLVAVKNETAMLTTFNEADMSAIQDLRRSRGASYEDEHGVKLGLTSLFAKAAAAALLEFPEVNASVDGADIVYPGRVDVGIAVSSARGLVVPVVRDADKKTLWEVERDIEALAEKARSGRIDMADLEGGTFTITNGGVFGSLLSTPILNPPQSAILGMHAVKPRPVVVEGRVEARPMMYLALSYDHRVIDGKESVAFLSRVKESLENPLPLLVL